MQPFVPLINRDIPLAVAWPPPRTRVDVEVALDRVRARDPVGHRAHTALAMIFLVLLPVSTAGSAIAFAILLGYTILRLPNIWRGLSVLTRMPVLLALAVWIVFTVASIAWSANRGQGWDEVRAARVALVPLLLWPVIGHARWLILAALVGVLTQNLVQAAQGVHLFGLAPVAGNRLDGSLHVIQTGAWCAAAMTWHVSAALHARGFWRWLSIAMMVAAAVGLVLTGSRGPWISAAVSVPLAVIVIGLRRPAVRRSAIVLVVIGLIVTAAASPFARRVVEPRVAVAFAEARAARDDGVYWTSVGLRIGLWRWAVSIWEQSPLTGTGAGAFKEALYEIEDYRALRDRQWNSPGRLEWITCEHAHSTYLHALATTGAIGAALLAVTLALIAWRCYRDPPDHPYADGSLFALLAWLIGAQFDCYTLNGHLFGLLMLITAVTLAPRPAPRTGRSSVPHLAQADGCSRGDAR